MRSKIFLFCQNKEVNATVQIIWKLEAQELMYISRSTAADRPLRQRGVFTLPHISKCRFLLKKKKFFLYQETLTL